MPPVSPSKPRLHLGLMCNADNGGFDSALTLAGALQSDWSVQLWSLLGAPTAGIKARIEAAGFALQQANPAITVKDGDAVFLYLNEYSMHFRNFAEQWHKCFAKAGSVQLAFNRTLGGLPLEHWMSAYLSQLYFQDSKMRQEWRLLTSATPLADVGSTILAPPVDLAPFLSINRAADAPLVIGRLAGDAEVETATLELYEKLADKLKTAEFWFMPASSAMQTRFTNHPRFHLYQPNEISVLDFFNACTIYLLDFKNSVPIPGPRSLVEAMAAGCVPVTINREGPKERIKHTQNGFLANNNAEFFDYTLQLANNSELRARLSAAARQRASKFTLESWTDTIALHAKHLA